MTANVTCLRMSGVPFLTETRMRSPMPADGFLPLTVLRFLTEMNRTTFAPELSQVLMVLPWTSPRVIRALCACMLVDLFYDDEFLCLADWSAFPDHDHVPL